MNSDSTELKDESMRAGQIAEMEALKKYPPVEDMTGNTIRAVLRVGFLNGWVAKADQERTESAEALRKRVRDALFKSRKHGLGTMNEAEACDYMTGFIVRALINPKDLTF